MSRITLVLKTNEGGMWVLPQIVELHRRGHSVTVIIPAGDGRLRRALDAASVPVEDSPFDFSFRPSFRLVRGLSKLRGLIRSTRPDVVFYHLYASALAARIASFGLRVRRVHMVAGPLYLESRVIRNAERLLCHLDDHLIAGSEYTARWYRKLGLAERRMSTVPYGVDVTRFRAGPDRRVSLFGCTDSTFVVIMVAYVYAPKSAVFPGMGIKGHDALFEAWKPFSLEHPDSLLVLLGAGFDSAGERHRQNLLRRFGVATNPTIRWFDSVNDVRDHYSSADLSVSPSLSENHGAALEAAAMSVPSIVSDAGGLPETVTASSGWLVAAGDAGQLTDALRAARREFDSGALGIRGAIARLDCEKKFSHAVVVPQVADAVVGQLSGRVVAFAEQRAWLRGATVRGRKSLPIVEALASKTPIRLLVRVGETELGGVPLAGGSAVVPLAWPADINPPHVVERLVKMLVTTVREVRRADVVYADQPGIVGGIGLLVGRAMRKPLVVNVVGDSNESVHPSVVPGIKGLVAHAVLPRLQTWACANATYTNYVTSRVLQARYPPRRARQVFASSTVTALGSARPRPFPTGMVSIVTVASLDQPYKGVADLLDAVALCRESGTDLRLTVVGDGRLRSRLERQSRALGRDVVGFAGYLYGPALYGELGRHDLFVLASWTDGLPQALIEAMADGLPAVATAVGGVPELLEPARVAAPRDAAGLADRILDLLSDEERWYRTIRANFDASAALLGRRSGVLDEFATAVARLAASSDVPAASS